MLYTVYGQLPSLLNRAAADMSKDQAFQVGAALSPNTGAIMTFRLLAGITSSAAHPIAPCVLLPPLAVLDIDNSEQCCSRGCVRAFFHAFNGFRHIY